MCARSLCVHDVKGGLLIFCACGKVLLNRFVRENTGELALILARALVRPLSWVMTDRENAEHWVQISFVFHHQKRARDMWRNAKRCGWVGYVYAKCYRHSVICASFVCLLLFCAIFPFLFVALSHSFFLAPFTILILAVTFGVCVSVCECECTRFLRLNSLLIDDLTAQKINDSHSSPLLSAYFNAKLTNTHTRTHISHEKCLCNSFCLLSEFVYALHKQ